MKLLRSTPLLLVTLAAAHGLGASSAPPGLELSGLWAPNPDPAPAAAGAHPGTAGQPGYLVVVDITLDEQGRYESGALVSSDDASAGTILNQYALLLAEQVTREPRLKDGVPVKATVRAPFFFPVDHDEGAAADRQPHPRLLANRPPAFPAALLASGEGGGAIIEFAVGPNGRVLNVAVLDSSDAGSAEAAAAAVKTWAFAPGKKDGLPVLTRWRVAFAFNPDGTPGDMKWRIAPRPALGSYTVRPTHPVPRRAGKKPGTP